MENLKEILDEYFADFGNTAKTENEKYNIRYSQLHSLLDDLGYVADLGEEAQTLMDSLEGLAEEANLFNANADVYYQIADSTSLYSIVEQKDGVSMLHRLTGNDKDPTPYVIAQEVEFGEAGFISWKRGEYFKDIESAADCFKSYTDYGRGSSNKKEECCDSLSEEIINISQSKGR